ncbi:solute carrier organic anion transporter family member 5A1-like isoform X1 [Ostrinia furnacalis]|uniref:solute carrier organic anion transporter family member 5A1-like isoform X1 n=2 Tax=Ostrinia furnacalis TaxID=93504 RepID=UPI00103F9FB4|nr:solute carrier organic anion transporter family member 5A1-like isoform X1 [Ostrinia furnacalis]
MTASAVAKVSAGAEAGPPGPAAEDAAMKGVEATPEEQERLATGNNNGSLDCKMPANQLIDPSCFHSTRMFMVVFLSGWVLQGMFLTYFVSVTTTIEKLFKIDSKTTGLLLAATEIGQICTALILTYLAGRGHRPRWIASMMLVLAAGVIGCIVPHLLYGTRLLDVHLDSHRGGEAPTCLPDDSNGTYCSMMQLNSTRERNEITMVVIPWLFICLLVVGVGQTGIATLGIPYVDDNVGSRQSPLYMAITIGIRVIGPALGFMLGAFSTGVYVNPLLDPGYSSDNPKWVGAWWLGMVFIAVFVVLLAGLMFCFPRQIKQEPLPPPPKKTVEVKGDPFLKGFANSIKRQLTNDILMYRTASSVLHLMPISGVYSFLPKYMETQFRLSTHDANLISGTAGILVMGMGIVTSGVIILRTVPTARTVAAWTAGTAAIYSIGMVILMFVSCPQENYRMLMPAEANLSMDCSAQCYCDRFSFSPVCGQDALTYISPCQAGCTGARQLGNNTWLYSNCSCVMPAAETLLPFERFHLTNLTAEEEGGYAISGECGGRCDQIYVFVAIFATIMFIHASGEVGGVLLNIRCTHKFDKAMAMGVIQFAIGTFGNVPCPIVFGAVIDAACRLRDSACNITGACVAYDSDSFRHFYLGLSAGLMFLAFLMDLMVYRRAGRIDMNPADAPAPPALLPAPTDTQL